MSRLLNESPLLISNQYDECEYMDRRKSSNEHDVFGISKTTENTELGRLQRPRCASIIPFDLDADKDIFRKQKDLKAEEMQEQFHRTETLMGLGSPNLRLVPTMVIPEDRAYRPILPLNPLLSPPPPFSPELPRYPAFTYQSDYGITIPNEKIRKNSSVRGNEYLGEFPGFSQSPFMQPSPSFAQVVHPTESFGPRMVQQDYFCLDAEMKDDPKDTLKVTPERMIGKLTVSQRKEKIQNYLKKRENRIWRKKISYDCRKKVADKRLRIKGRFVTREQAFALLGATPEELANNKLLRELITNNDNCSIVTSAQNMKIRNIQTLLSNSSKAKTEDKLVKLEKEPKKEILKKEGKTEGTKTNGNEGVRVEILTNNARERTVEIKIETIGKPQANLIPNLLQNQQEKPKLPKLRTQIFQFKRIKFEEINPNHIKYHKE